MGPTARLFCYPKQAVADRLLLGSRQPACSGRASRGPCGPAVIAHIEELKNGRMLVAETGKMAEVERMIAPPLDAMGYALVRVRLSGGGRPTLQVMAERRDGREMTVDDCAEISRTISAILDVEDPIAGAYVLEVSSPGIDRPLTRQDDFSRFAGHEAKVELSEPVDGRKRFRGRLIGLDGAHVRIAAEDGECLLPLPAIRSAKLVLTDALIAETLKRQNRQ